MTEKRLWVNGALLINNWTDHPPTTDTGTIYLSGGEDKGKADPSGPGNPQALDRYAYVV